MDVSTIASLYVHIIEPSLKVLAFFVVVVTVLYVINAMKDSKKKADFVNNAFSFIIKAVVVTFTTLGRATLFLGRLLLRIISTLIATITDFFTSKI